MTSSLVRTCMILLGAIGLAAIGIAAPARTPARGAQERYTLPAGDVAIYDLAGEVHIEPGSGDKIVVDVTRGGRDAGRLDVVTGPIGARQTLRVLFPSDRIVLRGSRETWRTTLRVRDDGTFDDDPAPAVPGGGRRVTISSWGGGLDARADLAVEVPAGGALTMHLAAGAVNVANVEGRIRVDAHAASVRARGTRGSLDVDNGSGDVVVQSCEGDLKVDTGSGMVTVDGTGGGRMVLDTGSGSVQVSEARVDELRVDTGSGSVELERIQAGDVSVDTGSGSVTIDLASDVSELMVDTGSGSVDLWVPRKLGAEFDIETGSGGIDVDVPHQSYRVERDAARGRIGDGRGRIHVETGSGRVRVRRHTGDTSSGGAVGALLGRALE